MIEKSFKIKKDVFKRRKLTTLQHKLRVVLKCYTVSDFLMIENDIFTFRKSYRISGIRIDDKNQLTGRFITDDINEDELNLTIQIL
jgi:hypothetical protein